MPCHSVRPPVVHNMTTIRSFRSTIHNVRNFADNYCQKLFQRWVWKLSFHLLPLGGNKLKRLRNSWNVFSDLCCWCNWQDVFMSRSCRGRMFSYVVKGIPFSIQILQEGNPESFFFFDFFNSNKALAFLVNIASMESQWVTTNGTLYSKCAFLKICLWTSSWSSFMCNLK